MGKTRTPTIQVKANQLLKAHRIKQPPVPVEKIAEAMGVRVRFSPVEGELAGMLVRGEDQAIIGINSLHHPNRQRFTIAHELGHFLLHEGEIHIDHKFGINRRDTVSSLAVDPEEIEANRFAAELLMPYEMIMTDLKKRYIDVENEDDIKLLAKKYQVSVQAMTFRIMNLLEL